jgi:hypothetical protein
VKARLVLVHRVQDRLKTKLLLLIIIFLGNF